MKNKSHSMLKEENEAGTVRVLGQDSDTQLIGRLEYLVMKMTFQITVLKESCFSSARSPGDAQGYLCFRIHQHHLEGL
jgi:hypothetical protein